MLALPHLSGSELVATLERLGFHVERRAGGLATLVCGPNSVVVPETATLSPALVASILRAAEVAPFDFISGLEQRHRRAEGASAGV